jgi:hypothetical protein
MCVVAADYTYTVSHAAGPLPYRARCHEFSGVECHAADPGTALSIALSMVAGRMAGMADQGVALPPPIPDPASDLGPLRAAVRIATEEGQTRAGRVLAGLVARECRAHLSRGGTIDELAIELGMARSAVDHLLTQGA